MAAAAAGTIATGLEAELKQAMVPAGLLNRQATETEMRCIGGGVVRARAGVVLNQDEHLLIAGGDGRG